MFFNAIGRGRPCDVIESPGESSRLYNYFSVFVWIVTYLYMYERFSFQFLCFFLETKEGKNISPFHDIPLIAETEQVTLW